MSVEKFDSLTSDQDKEIESYGNILADI